MAGGRASCGAFGPLDSQIAASAHQLAISPLRQRAPLAWKAVRRACDVVRLSRRWHRLCHRAQQRQCDRILLPLVLSGLMFCVWCFYFTSARVEAAADQYDRQLRWGTGAGQWILEAPPPTPVRAPLRKISTATHDTVTAQWLYLPSRKMLEISARASTAAQRTGDYSANTRFPSASMEHGHFCAQVARRARTSLTALSGIR